MEDMELWYNAIAKSKLFYDKFIPINNCYSALVKRRDAEGFRLLYLDNHKIAEKGIDGEIVDKILNSKSGCNTAYIILGKTSLVGSPSNTHLSNGRIIYSVIDSKGNTIIPFDEGCTKIWNLSNSFFLGYSSKTSFETSHLVLYQLNRCIDRLSYITFPHLDTMGDIQVIITYRKIHSLIRGYTTSNIYYIKGNKVVKHILEDCVVDDIKEAPARILIRTSDDGIIMVYYDELNAMIENLDDSDTFKGFQVKVMQTSDGHTTWIRPKDS